MRLTKMVLTEVKNRKFGDSILIDGSYNEESAAFSDTSKLFDLFYTQVQAESAVLPVS